jgi:polyphosphate kinase
MKRNLTGRVETVMPILDDGVRTELDRLLDVYSTDNDSAWDCDADGVYRRRRPATGERRRATQDVFIRRAAGKRDTPPGEKVRKKAG